MNTFKKGARVIVAPASYPMQRYAGEVLRKTPKGFSVRFECNGVAMRETFTARELSAPLSWRPEVIADSTGAWLPNGLRFATETEAADNAQALAWRWLAVREWRAAPSMDPPNYRWADGALVALESAAPSVAA